MSRRVALLTALALASACATTTEKPTAPPAAQADAPAAPAAQKPALPDPEVPLQADGDVWEGRVAGVLVLVKPLPEAELVAAQLAVMGGARNWDAQTAGIEELALNVAQSGGAGELDKYAFATRLATLGSSVGAGAGLDYSGISFKSLARNWEETFGLATDVFLRPQLPAAELELQRTRQLQSLKREQEHPDSRLGLLAHRTIFAGHPYQHRSIGTPENVRRFTREDLVAHLEKLRETSRLVLVVVGNVQPERVAELVRARLGHLPRGDYQPTALPLEPFAAPSLTVAPEPQLPTNYITGVFRAPSWKDPEFAAAMVAMSTFRHRLFEEVRTKRNLSYAPGAGLTMNSQVPRGSIYVTATDPNTTIGVMLDEARKLAAEPIPEREFNGAKEVFRTGLLSSLETTDEQAGYLMRAQLYAGDWRLSRVIPERVKAVTPADVQAFAKKYVARLQMFVLGDPAKIDEALFKSL